MKVLIICLAVVVSIFYSASVFAQTCPMSKGGDDAEKECGKVMTKFIGNKIVCPVMGTVFKADKDTTYYKHDGKIYYFCCPGCVGKFKAAPEKYIK